eukprot:6173632-Pleurochrysis_carterae.AAC.12
MYLTDLFITGGRKRAAALVVGVCSNPTCDVPREHIICIPPAWLRPTRAMAARHDTSGSMATRS